jgi:hypothetical protein
MSKRVLQALPHKILAKNKIVWVCNTEKAKIGGFFGNQGGVKPPHSQKGWKNNLRERR